MSFLISYHLTMNVLKYSFFTLNFLVLSVNLLLKPGYILANIFDTATLEILNAVESFCEGFAVNFY